jgi:glycosyltransferase involved in cell wall biosynthesis
MAGVGPALRLISPSLENDPCPAPAHPPDKGLRPELLTIDRADRVLPKVRDNVSVIIPCLNAAGTIASTIESASAQPESKSEITVVDDGSVDDSVAVAGRFEPRVRVIIGPSRGVSAARNRGIAETSGEWIVFLDADDLLMPGTLEKRLDTAKATGADVVVCDWQEFTEEDGKSQDGHIRSVDWCALEEDPETACATHVWATTAALMYRRSLVEKIGGFRDELPVIQDARFLFDAAYHGARFAQSPHVGARYRKSPKSLSRRDPTRFWRDVLLNGVQIEALWRARGPLPARQQAALCDIYNGAAHGLFRAGDASFRNALEALRAVDLPIGWRNRVAETFSGIFGQPAAIRAADLWTAARKAFDRSPRSPGRGS